ncbi:hypothetical protein [Maritimibacter sp. DP1N21-5]|uniref:hypothetical protein n=1 Tax=Maritimibacter sp. DP1N21-5 TaxID=2836867 RepID=UPI001C48BADD|nr:hypothetical protein [Maritimibacter sp. DP1N21-5]MBV7409290.1 hypothetical protein [Maritimibacter sp. DP1N21-5]
MRALALGFTCLATVAMADVWEVGRFGVSIELPDEHEGRDLVWRADPPPANADGQRFRVDGTGISVAAYGGYMVENSFERTVEAARVFAEQDGSTVTYRASGEGWAVLSGRRADGTVYYHRLALAPDCEGQEIIANVMIEREPGERWFDTLTGPIAKSLGGCAE